jgi:hypothetical protein
MMTSDSIALGSAVVAACALGTSIWQGLVARRHARLSSKPVIETELNSHVDAGIKVLNCGLGPAVITGILARIEEQSFNLCTPEGQVALIERLIPDPQARLLVHVHLVQPGSTLGVGREVSLLKLVGGAKTQELSTYLARTFRVMSLEISYESMYGERYVAAHRTTGTV